MIDKSQSPKKAFPLTHGKVQSFLTFLIFKSSFGSYFLIPATNRTWLDERMKERMNESLCQSQVLFMAPVEE